jgi:Uma2 family endonuclease
MCVDNQIVIGAHGMIANPSFKYLSPADYLVAEEVSPIKHEYREGEAYAMAGASDAHVTISLNVATLLRGHLRGSGCRVFMSDMKLRIADHTSYYYPDVMVTCDSRDRPSTQFKQFPCLVIEVLSDITEGFDRGDKFLDYQSIETLQEYLLVSQNRRRIDYFQKNSGGQWVMESYGLSDTLRLQTVDLSIAVTDIYEDVEPPSSLA